MGCKSKKICIKRSPTPTTFHFFGVGESEPGLPSFGGERGPGQLPSIEFKINKKHFYFNVFAF